MHVVIIGGGIAGCTAAQTLKHLSKTTEVTLISEERPLYSPCIFPHCLSGKIDSTRLFIRTPADLQKLGIRLFEGRATAIDVARKEVRLADGRSIKYDKLILATGSRPFIPPIKGVEKEGIFPVKSLSEFEKLYNAVQHKRGTAVIVGAGAIGIEVAVSLRKRMWKVFIVELLNRVLPRLLDEKPARILENMLRANGIEIFTGEKVTEFLGDKEVKAVVTDKREIKCDIVLLSVGMRPRVELAQEAGIKLGKQGGIIVDEYMRTNIPDIFACGDCVETLEAASGRRMLSLLWHTAALQGYIAAYNCLGYRKKYSSSLNTTVINLPEIGVAVASNGITTEDLKDKEYKVVEKQDAGNYLRVLVADDEVKGVQFVGRDIGEEKLGALFGAIRKRVKIVTLKELVRKGGALYLIPQLSTFLDYFY